MPLSLRMQRITYPEPPYSRGEIDGTEEGNVTVRFNGTNGIFMHQVLQHGMTTLATFLQGASDTVINTPPASTVTLICTWKEFGREAAWKEEISGPFTRGTVAVQAARLYRRAYQEIRTKCGVRPHIELGPGQKYPVLFEQMVLTSIVKISPEDNIHGSGEWWQVMFGVNH
ncbi:hypothetical protein AX15_003284 [Amanita polypyramis BW_CC]|nr:hypothetical protein AX15_003284 [Amanita polypyramis BW_CC]